MFPIRDHNHAPRFPFITLMLILINVFVFVFSMDSDQFILKYSLIPKAIDISNILTFYPFLTSMFLHAGWLHLLSNMWFLWIFGDNIESLLGKFGYLMFYLLSGLTAAFFQYLLSPISNIPILGASGAIAGILGAYIVFFPHAKIDTLVIFFGFIQIIQVSAGFMLGYWFILQLFSGIGSITDIASGGVAWWAHITGFGIGYLLAKAFGAKQEIYE